MKRTIRTSMLVLVSVMLTVAPATLAQKGRRGNGGIRERFNTVARGNSTAVRERFNNAAKRNNGLKERFNSEGRGNSSSRELIPNRRRLSQSETSKSRKGLTTPTRYFGNKTRQEIEARMEKKYGGAESRRRSASTYHNRITKRSFNVHYAADHNDGKPHVDVRRRGKRYPDRKYNLRENR